MYSCKKKQQKKTTTRKYIYKKTGLTNTFSLQNESFLEATGNQSHQGHRDMTPTDGGDGSGGCQQRIMLEDNCWVQGADERSQSLHHRSPAQGLGLTLNQKYQLQNRCGNNPLSSHHSCATTLIFLLHLCGPGVRRCSASPPAHQTKLKCSLFYHSKRFNEVKK